MADALDHDSPWKTALDQFPRSLLELTFPEVAASIDWSVEPKSLEQELREIRAVLPGNPGDERDLAVGFWWSHLLSFAGHGCDECLDQRHTGTCSIDRTCALERLRRMMR